MTKKTLAERFEVLEQEYNSVMSTKYMGTSAFSHRSREYIDSAKVITGLQEQKVT